MEGEGFGLELENKFLRKINSSFNQRIKETIRPLIQP